MDADVALGWITASNLSLALAWITVIGKDLHFVLDNDTGACLHPIDLPANEVQDTPVNRL